MLPWLLQLLYWIIFVTRSYERVNKATVSFRFLKMNAVNSDFGNLFCTSTYPNAKNNEVLYIRTSVQQIQDIVKGSSAVNHQ